MYTWVMQQMCNFPEPLTAYILFYCNHINNLFTKMDRRVYFKIDYSPLFKVLSLNDTMLSAMKPIDKHIDEEISSELLLFKPIRELIVI